MQIEKKWIVVLFSYAILLFSMGYIAFFHLEFNPVVNIGEIELRLLANENSKEIIEQALREESKSFQLKRDLAIQSFNIILGAVLGFLSAAVVLKSDKNDMNSAVADETINNNGNEEKI